MFLENKLAVTGVGIFVFFLLFCFLGPHLYLGLRIRPPETEWGLMLANGTQYLNIGYWWLIVPAGFCIVIVIAAAIFIGEGLRDAVEVRLQRR